MVELQPPNRVTSFTETTIFLGGSIEMDTVEKWQDKLKFDLTHQNVMVFNPRRDDWDSNIVQRSYDAGFSEQVNWELDHLERADIIVFYFDPNTKSPITLMELGYFAAVFAKTASYRRQTILVCCPDGFWRKGNVEVLCERSGIKVLNSYDELLSALLTAIR